MSFEKTTVENEIENGTFVDRRAAKKQDSAGGFERRQFSDGHQGLSPEAAELGIAIDQYKLTNSRRYITHEEMIQIIKSIGYAKS